MTINQIKMAGGTRLFMLEERVVAVGDVYQALGEERPDRSCKSPGEVTLVVESMVKTGVLCPEAA